MATTKEKETAALVQRYGISYVPFKAIQMNGEANARKDYGNMAALTEDIRAHGLLQPVIVRARKTPGDKPIVIDGEKFFVERHLIAGFRRHRAVGNILKADATWGGGEIPVVQVPWNAPEVPFIQLRENALRKDFNPVETADAVITLMEGGESDEDRKRGGYDLKTIASKTGQSLSWLKLLLEVRRACCDEVLAALAKGDITFAVALDMAKMPPERQREALKAYGLAKTTRGKRAARREVSERAGKPSKPTAKEQRAMHDALVVLVDNPEWKGVRRGIGFAMGIEAGKLRSEANAAIKALNLTMGDLGASGDAKKRGGKAKAGGKAAPAEAESAPGGGAS